MRALPCPASLKGVLSARRAARRLLGMRVVGGDAVELPIADGGEGTADALFAVLEAHLANSVVSDPLGRPVPARWLVLPDRACGDRGCARRSNFAAARSRQAIRRVE